MNVTRASSVIVGKSILAGLLCPLAFVSLAAAAPSPWSQAAVQDLTAMHDLIRDNHPGPVDAENPGFSRWLDRSGAALLAQARNAGSLHDYQLVLRDYANGFADGHLGVVMKDTDPQLWPGFLVRADAPDAPLRVSVIGTGQDAPADIQPGAVIESCGGRPARELLEDRILRPLLNPHVPQRLQLASSWLMVADADARQDQWPGCVVSAGGRRRTVMLGWRPISPAALTRERVRSSGIDVSPTQLRQVGDVWLISMPSFYPQDAAATSRLQSLVTKVKSQASALHAARHVVLDLRGNDGGNDDWGFEVAEALWGKAAVDAVEADMPSTIDWRVSARNLAAMQHDATSMTAQGQAAGAAYFTKLAGRMRGAFARRQIFMRETGDPPVPAPHLVSPFLHPVYVLTTPHCASACLDVVDLLNGLPGTVRVGLETSSDTDYLEVAEAELPSGHATLHYAMKVYRERKRGADVSYKPTIAWPGGDMNDASIAEWIDTLR